MEFGHGSPWYFTAQSFVSRLRLGGNDKSPVGGYVSMFLVVLITRTRLLLLAGVLWQLNEKFLRRSKSPKSCCPFSSLFHFLLCLLFTSVAELQGRCSMLIRMYV
jgi:hypothetical protein